MASNFQHAGKDFYKVLRVSHTASIQEIKTSYRKLAMELHPDKHDGCPQKLAQFKQVNEAYSVLIDMSKRKEYDFNIGNRYNRNRRTPPPRDYRKVYAPRPPPDWKFTWDHVKHYEMHYGDGMKKEAIKEAKRQAEAEGFFEYHSPLGKGFTFADSTTKDGEAEFNPYSKYTPQGPPKIVFEYEEGEMSSKAGAKQNINYREKIVEEMQNRRSRRRQSATQQQRYSSTSTTKFEYPMGAAARTAAAAAGATPTKRQPNDCVIL